MWSVQQQTMLNAMGYTLYARPSALPPKKLDEALPALARHASADSALFKAVLKAAQGKDISALGIDMNALRSSPHAKRALWPALRRIIKA
jgi:hypothetical protein